MKTCKTCGETKPFDQFHKDRSKSDGLNFYCKPCVIAKQKEYATRPPRHQDPEGLKTCQRCKTVKPVTDFNNERKRFDGLSRRCRTCDSELTNAWRSGNLDKAAVLQKEWRHKNRDRSADYSLKQHYGIPLGTYDLMFKAQGGRCAICGTDNPSDRERQDGVTFRFHVDHCHDTNEVRGLLCHHCNVGIGNLRHDREILEKAIAYVSRKPRQLER